MEFNAHITAHSFIGLGCHKGLVPPSVVPAPLFHFSMDTLLGLTIGAKYSKTVIGPCGFQFIGKENDSGKVVPHLSIPPTNVLLPITIAFGMSKPMFSASKVLIDVDGEATPLTACCFPVVPLSLNQACNDPCNFPGDVVIAPCSVNVGLSLADILMGVIMIAVDVAISAAVNWASNKIAKGLVDKVGEKVFEKAAEEFVDETVEDLAKEGVKVATKEAEEMTEEVIENMLERPAVQFVERGIHKLIDWGVDKVLVKPFVEPFVEHHAEHAVESEEEGKEGHEDPGGEGHGPEGPHAEPPGSGDGPGSSGGDPEGSASGAGAGSYTGTPSTVDSLTGADGSNPDIHTAD